MVTFLNKKGYRLSTALLMSFVLFMGIDIARADGDIDNLGTLIIKGNLVNMNTAATDLGTGTIEFSGTTPQTISGPNVFGKLTLNNSSGLTLLDDQQVNSTLTLTSGLLKLGTSGDKNLLLGPSASIAGSPSSTAMVVATGTGEFRKEFGGTGSFTYPVGDADVTSDYSPVTATFTGGTFSPGNFLGISLKDEKDPLITADSYLTRYWTLNNSGISDPACNLVFNFVENDVTGTKTDLYCLKTSPVKATYNKYSSGNQLTATVNAFGRFTGSNSLIDLTPNITAEPNLFHGVKVFDIIVKVTDLLSFPTSGQVTVKIPKDIRWTFNVPYSQSETLIGTTSVNNADWSYSQDGTYHIFTSSTVIPGENFSNFGFYAKWDAGQTAGIATITSQLVEWGGGENRIENNVDSEKIDYFIY